MNYIPGESENGNNIVETCLICVFSTSVTGLTRQFSNNGEYLAMGFGILAVVIVINSISKNLEFGKRIMWLFVAVIGMIIGSGFLIQACLLGTIVYLILRNSDKLLNCLESNSSDIDNTNVDKISN